MRTIGVIATLLVWSGVCVTRGADAADDLTPQRRQELEKKAAALIDEGGRYFRAGNYAKAIDVAREALEVSRVLYPKAKYPDGHPSLASCLNNLTRLRLRPTRFTVKSS